MDHVEGKSISEVSDKDLVKAVLAGNKEEFRYIIERYEHKLKAYIAKLIGFHQQDVEDIASNTFIKTYINLALYNPSLGFSSWIYRIAHNETINYIKKNKKYLSVDIDQHGEKLSYTVDFDKPNKSDIQHILNKLSENDRNLLILFYLEELSIREIAEIMKSTENSIKSRLSQARKKAQKLTAKD